jgi:hypothetical protein
MKHERLMNRDIYIQHHAADGFTLSCIYKDEYYHRRYIFYSVRNATRRFKEYVYEEYARLCIRRELY